jgi:hypothetical protein
MDSATLDELRKQFEAVVATIARGLSAASSHVVALAAKWDKTDLVPGLSDLDLRVVCDDGTTADDWVEIDRAAGRIHLEMVRGHPQWNRINEHTPGACLTVPETLDRRVGSPEYAVWSLWWGDREWFGHFKSQAAARDFDRSDEHYHLSRFLSYYSTYIHGIDPPVNLGAFEPKYALHSRCWHYFAPPMLSAASILARRNLSGKRESLAWLRDNGYVAEQVDAVLKQVAGHYETPEQTDAHRLQAFEDLLFSGFERLFPALAESIEYLDIDRSAQPAEMKKQLAALPSDPVATLSDNVHFARIRAGRCYFFVNAPDHFDTGHLIRCELSWLKRLYVPVFASLRTLLGDQTLSPEQCFQRLGMSVSRIEQQALDRACDLANRAGDDRAVPALFAEVVDWFPHYYRLVEGALARITARMAETPLATVTKT